MGTGFCKLRPGLNRLGTCGERMPVNPDGVVWLVRPEQRMRAKSPGGSWSMLVPACGGMWAIMSWCDFGRDRDLEEICLRRDPPAWIKVGSSHRGNGVGSWLEALWACCGGINR
jgi:hypothetical protein